MNIDLANDWLRKEVAGSETPPSVYYGYAQSPSATDDESVWSIRKIIDIHSVESVTWNDNKIFEYNAVWNDRLEAFIAPTASLSITYSVTNSTNSFNNSSSIINASWDDIKGVNQYNILISDQNGIIYDYLGGVFLNTYATTKLTSVQSNNSYQFKGVPSMTYSLTVTAVNTGGSTSETVYITT